MLNDEAGLTVRICKETRHTDRLQKFSHENNGENGLNRQWMISAERKGADIGK